MEAAEQQYQRDLARLEAHRLALKDDEFQRVSTLIRQEAREHFRYYEQRGARIKLNDRDMHVIYISSEDGQRVATIAFNSVRHEIEVKEVGGNTPVSYLFRVDVTPTGERPVVIGFKWKTEPLSTVSDDTVMTAVRHAIDALTQ